jgi:hypothetical protein
MTTQTDNVIDCGKGGIPSEQDLFLIGLGDELVRRNLPYLNDVLRQLVTLSTALAGGSIALFKNDNLTAPGYRFTAIVFFLLALASAMYGMLPRAGVITRRAPNVIRSGLDNALNAKRTLCSACACFIVGGLVILLIGLL